jgi:hypothetical protein
MVLKTLVPNHQTLNNFDMFVEGHPDFTLIKKQLSF